MHVAVRVGCKLNIQQAIPHNRHSDGSSSSSDGIALHSVPVALLLLLLLSQRSLTP